MLPRTKWISSWSLSATSPSPLKVSFGWSSFYFPFLQHLQVFIMLFSLTQNCSVLPSSELCLFFRKKTAMMASFSGSGLWSRLFGGMGKKSANEIKKGECCNRTTTKEKEETRETSRWFKRKILVISHLLNGGESNEFQKSFKLTYWVFQSLFLLLLFSSSCCVCSKHNITFLYTLLKNKN